MASNAQNNQRLHGTWTAANNKTYCTLSVWMRRSASSTVQCIGSNSSVTQRLAFYHAADNILYIVCGNGSNSFGSVDSNITGWNHYALAFDGSAGTNATRLKAYINGTQQTLSFNLTVPSTTSNSMPDFNLNYLPLLPEFGTGDYAEFGVWEQTLLSAEIASLAKGFKCHRARPQGLRMYLPHVRSIIDPVGRIALTDVNTTVANHPRVY